MWDSLVSRRLLCRWLSPWLLHRVFTDVSEVIAASIISAIALVQEAVSTFKTSVNFPEDGHLHPESCFSLNVWHQSSHPHEIKGDNFYHVYVNARGFLNVNRCCVHNTCGDQVACVQGTARGIAASRCVLDPAARAISEFPCSLNI